jgi:hypothetical protein
MASVSNDKIRSLYANRRKKGLYLDFLQKFLDSGETGISVRETWPSEFPHVTVDPENPEKKIGKQVTSIKQGFDNAKEKKDAPENADIVDVIVDGEDVYLINKVLYGGDAESAEDTEDAEVPA